MRNELQKAIGTAHIRIAESPDYPGREDILNKLLRLYDSPNAYEEVCEIIDTGKELGLIFALKDILHDAREQGANMYKQEVLQGDDYRSQAEAYIGRFKKQRDDAIMSGAPRTPAEAESLINSPFITQIKEGDITIKRGRISAIIGQSKTNKTKTNKMKKFFHTFRYQNGNIDRDITIAVAHRNSVAMVGYSVRTPEDRPNPDDLKKVEESNKLRKTISLGRALSDRPLKTYVSGSELVNEKGVLRAVALNWAERIKRDGAHTYITGVPEPEKKTEKFRNEKGQTITVTRTEGGVNVSLPENFKK